jgi:hypothetical protein
MPLTTYYFANAGNALAGGASFVTDSSGFGPNDSANWSAANYFSGTYNYWSDKGGGTATAWSNSSDCTFNHCACSVWTSSAANGEYGNSANTTAARWTSAEAVCSNTYNLICFVNP